ncbi:MAG: beta-glucosidase [Ruminococcaceae bacterium]|jgi:beta-glucosidase|nr:beta-glucosidase [Oscillospiraceae bacterium]
MNPYEDRSLSFEERAADLLSRMTLREKILILIETSPANERLGIPPYNHGNEALHGVIRLGKYTVFPQAIAFGAMFDPDLMEVITEAISDEARAMHHHGQKIAAKDNRFGGRYSGLLTFWSPDLNLCRDPRWGRTGETYGEDPYLAGKTGAAFVRGLQGKDPKYLKAVSTPKHFTANNEEHNRFSCDAKMSRKSFREYHLEPFRIAVEEGHPAAVMAAYNAINGIPCHENRELLTDILRGEWGFDGYAVSDCSGIARIWDSHKRYEDPADAASAALNAGIDLECGGYSAYEHMYAEFLEKQVNAGKTTEARIDEACLRVLTARFRLGQFDPDEDVPFSKIPLSVVGCAKHRELALKSALESIVLLKNDGVLPISRDKTLAVVGNNAAACQFGDYSGDPLNRPISPAEGLTAEFGAAVTAVPWKWRPDGQTYTPVDSAHLSAPDGTPGLRGEYYANAGFLGEPKTRADAAIDFAWNDQMPDTYITTLQYSIRWTGFLCPEVTGVYLLRLRWSGSAPCEKPVLTVNGAELGQEAAVPLEAGAKIPVTVEYRKAAENPSIRFEWAVPDGELSDPFAEEVACAEDADVTVAVVGLGKEYESEGHDRETLRLPPEQEEFLARLFDTGKPVVVVLENGSPLSVPTIAERAAAVIEAWYPGERGGEALAALLSGRENFSGRLPATFPVSEDDLPPFDDYEMEHGRTYMYAEKKPLWSFGFGLSYARFSFSSLRAEKTGGAEWTVTVSVTNEGKVPGDEVAQLYIDSAGLAGQPNYRLRGFRRVRLEPGETREVSFPLTEADFTLFDRDGIASFVPGSYRIWAGGSLPDARSRELGAADCVSLVLSV